MDRPSLIDDPGPRNRVETWMALVLTLACPLVYWTIVEHRTLRTASLALLVAIVVVTIAMAYVEQKRAKDDPKRYRRGMACTLAVLGCVHLAVLGIGVVTWGSYVRMVPGNTHPTIIQSIPVTPTELNLVAPPPTGRPAAQITCSGLGRLD